MTEPRLEPPLISSLLLLWDQQRPRSQQIEPGPSDFFGCRRRFGYKSAGVTPCNPTSSTRAAMGSAIHEKVAEVLRDLNRPGWLIEQKVTFAGMSGTFDLYVPNTVIDWKTTSHRGVQTIGVHGPYQSHLAQIHWYGVAAIHSLKIPVDLVRLNYICRDCGEEIVYEEPLSLDAVAQALEWGHRIKSMEFDDLPRDYAPDSVFCRGCPYGGDDGGICWSGGVPDRDPRSVEYRDNLTELLEELYQLRYQEIEPLQERVAHIRGTLSAMDPGDNTIIVAGNRAVQWRGTNRALYFVPPPIVPPTA